MSSDSASTPKNQLQIVLEICDIIIFILTI